MYSLHACGKVIIQCKVDSTKADLHSKSVACIPRSQLTLEKAKIQNVLSIHMSLSILSKVIQKTLLCIIIRSSDYQFVHSQ